MRLIDEVQRVIDQAVPTSREVPGPIAFLRLSPFKRLGLEARQMTMKRSLIQ
jgi:hypothetical protein